MNATHSSVSRVAEPVNNRVQSEIMENLCHEHRIMAGLMEMHDFPARALNLWLSELSMAFFNWVKMKKWH